MGTYRSRNDDSAGDPVLGRDDVRGGDGAQLSLAATVVLPKVKLSPSGPTTRLDYGPLCPAWVTEVLIWLVWAVILVAAGVCCYILLMIAILDV